MVILKNFSHFVFIGDVAEFSSTMADSVSNGLIGFRCVDSCEGLWIELSKNAPLIVTGDHGYIYLGANPARYLWGSAPKKQERFGGEYGDNCLEIDGKKVAIGRIHVNVGPGTNTFIAHGGVSLTESLVPVVTIEVSGTN